MNHSIQNSKTGPQNSKTGHQNSETGHQNFKACCTKGRKRQSENNNCRSFYSAMSHTHVHAVESAHLEAFVVRTRQLEERIAKIQMNVQQALVPQNLLRGLSMAMPFGCLYPRAFHGILRSSEAACPEQLRGRISTGCCRRGEAGCAAADAQHLPMLFHVCRARAC